jgi:hypothetical protein
VTVSFFFLSFSLCLRIFEPTQTLELMAEDLCAALTLIVDIILQSINLSHGLTMFCFPFFVCVCACAGAVLLSVAAPLVSQDIEPTQTLELTAEDLKPDAATLLKFVKFQRVSSLSIFVEARASLCIIFFVPIVVLKVKYLQYVVCSSKECHVSYTA